MDSYLNGQCKKQWALLWPMAREGDGDALSELAFELRRDLIMPASDSDMNVDLDDKAIANVFVMTIYGAAASKHSDDRRNLNFVFDPARWRKGDVTVVSIRSGSISYGSIKPPPPVLMTKLKNCLSQANSSATGDRCVAEAIKLGLIPRFPEYKNAIDAVLTTYRPENCLRRRPW
ncbi:hypothetical protein NKI51_29005 [Mesorhizobium australicum]|uniref:hypothetical protein n=1 Tax=Mesorhizobium australicum TaxID=536018 RepID=UPI00333BFE81